MHAHWHVLTHLRSSTLRTSNKNDRLPVAHSTSACKGKYRIALSVRNSQNVEATLTAHSTASIESSCGRSGVKSMEATPAAHEKSASRETVISTRGKRHDMMTPSAHARAHVVEDPCQRATIRKTQAGVISGLHNTVISVQHQHVCVLSCL